MKKILFILSILLLSMMLTSCSEEPEVINEKFNNEETTGEMTEDRTKESTEESAPESTEVTTVEDDQEESEDIKVEDELDIYLNGFNLATYELVKVFEDTNFSLPLQLTYDYKESPYVYIVEKQGLIKRMDTINNTMEVFMDLTQTVDSTENEQGLLGLAFHPNFPEDPRFFVYYTEQNLSKLVSYEVRKAEDDKGYAVETTTQKDIIEFSQPYANHNGGHIAFGTDGYLYIASGDGGASGDPNNHAQNLTNLLGKILRIDIDVASNTLGYQVPEDNPFAKVDSARGEIYAYGLRNPWKFSFDKHREIMIAADVGQDAMEEINRIENGGNYGWPRFEGTQIYKSSVELDGVSVEPIYVYGHSEGQSITGGYTYYGEALPSLFGVYVYGDFMTGTIWGLWLDQDNQVYNETILTTDLKIASFGLDANEELYILDYRGGIYQLKK